MLAIAGLPMLGACSTGDPAPKLRADTARLAHTSFAAGTAAPLDPRANLLWCASLPLAWKQLEGVVGGPLRVAEPTDAFAQVSGESWDTGDLDASAVTTRVGRVEDGVVDAIQQDLERHGGARDGALDRLVADDPRVTLVAYARLDKAMRFATRFEDLPKGPIAFHSGEDGAETTAVDAFGLAGYDSDKKSHRRIAEQVRIHEREGDGPGDDEYVLELVPEGGRDRILVCRVDARATLGATWEAARALLDSTPAAKLEHDDSFALPELDLELSHAFTTLRGLPLENPGFEKAYLADVRQELRLRLDEEGMVVRSFAWAAMGATARAGPRRLVLDRPFLLAAIQAGAKRPYLLAWIAHPEILVPAESP